MVRKLIFTANTLLLCALFLAACAGSRTVQKEDEELSAESEAVDNSVWTTLEYISQLDGNWKGACVLAVPADESKGFPKTAFYADLSLSYMGRNVIQQITINFYMFLEDLVAAHPTSGLTVDDLWERYFENNYAGYPLIKDEYALIITDLIPVENLFNNTDDKLYISRDETRLRWLIKNGLLNGLLEPFGVIGYAEFILEKY
jgi:hypothetical protein